MKSNSQEVPATSWVRDKAGNEFLGELSARPQKKVTDKRTITPAKAGVQEALRGLNPPSARVVNG